MTKIIVTGFMGILFLTACTNEPKLVNSQKIEHISKEDREEYNQSLKNNLAIVKLHKEAEKVIKRYIGDCSVSKEGHSSESGDRFSLVMQSYRNSK